MKTCYVIKYDELIGYEVGLEIQKRISDKINENQEEGVLLLLEHNPVFTVGKNGGKENLLISKEGLNENGIELCETNRGGNITYHGPGQLVVYPIFNLKKFEKNIIWYVRQLEEVVIRTLATFDIKAYRKPEYPGVWVGEKKISAIGVHAKKWITMHGFSLNITVNKEHFALINPCGITNFGIASLDDYINKVEINEVVKRVETAFEEVFGIEFIDISQEQLLMRYGDRKL